MRWVGRGVVRGKSWGGGHEDDCAFSPIEAVGFGWAGVAEALLAHALVWSGVQRDTCPAGKADSDTFWLGG